MEYFSLLTNGFVTIFVTPIDIHIEMDPIDMWFSYFFWRGRLTERFYQRSRVDFKAFYHPLQYENHVSIYLLAYRSVLFSVMGLERLSGEEIFQEICLLKSHHQDSPVCQNSYYFYYNNFMWVCVFKINILSHENYTSILTTVN